MDELFARLGSSAVGRPRLRPIPEHLQTEHLQTGHRHIPVLQLTPVRRRVLEILGDRYNNYQRPLHAREIAAEMGYSTPSTLYGAWGPLGALRQHGIVSPAESDKKVITLTEVGLLLYYYLKSIDNSERLCYPDDAQDL